MAMPAFGLGASDNRPELMEEVASCNDHDSIYLDSLYPVSLS